MLPRTPWSRPRRVKTPTVLQMEATECGAAALGIILGYHGRHVPLGELRVECGVSRDGSNALSIKRAARNHGLDGKGYQVSAEGLRDLALPILAFWEMNHFLVVEGFGRGKVYLNDPASGRRSVSVREFAESYAGIAFEFKRAEGFRKGGSRPSTWRGIARRVHGSLAAVVFAVMAGAALMAAELVGMTFAPVFADHVLVAERHQWIRPLLVAMGLTLAFRLMVGSIQLEALRRLQKVLASTHAARFVWHVLRLPTAFYQQRSAGDVAGRVDGNASVAELISGQLATALIGVLMIAVYGGVMLAFDPVLAAVGMTAGVLNLAGVALANRFLVDENIKASHFRGLLGGAMMQAVKMIETIKAGASEPEALVRLTGHQAKLTNASQRIAAVAGLVVILPPLLSLTTTAAVLLIGGARVVDGVLSVGALLACQTLLTQFSRPFADLVALGSSAQLLQAELARLDDVETYPIDPVFKPTATERSSIETVGRLPPRRLSGMLEFRDVTFGFGRTVEEPLLNRFSMTVRPGSRVALVGASGSGKSTIGKLAAGLLRPWSGEILYDGFRIDQIPREVFTDQVGLVDDQTMLFAGSIRENLTLWDESVADLDLSAAALDAAIHAEVVRLRSGYSARLSEGARNFSGGQRQRLEIARALLRHPALVILDEATSALDPITEARVDDNLRRRGCTCLIIAHRLSTIRDCDEIIVLRLGQVIQRGSHDELMADRDGFYAELQAIQGEQADPLSEATRPARRRKSTVTVSAHAELASVPREANGHASEKLVPALVAPEEPPEPLDVILLREGELVTTAGNRPLPLDDPGAVWRVISGQVDVFYVRPEPGQEQGRRRHLFRVEEWGSIFALEGVRSAEAGGLLAVGVGPALLIKVPKGRLLRLSLEYPWRQEVAAMVDEWVERISRATAVDEPNVPLGLIERNEPSLVADGGCITAGREVLWFHPGDDQVRFLGRVDVPACAYDSRFPLAPSAWLRLGRGGSVRACDTETLCENGDLWAGLRRFHRVVLDAIAGSVGSETTRADTRRDDARRRDAALIASALAELTRPGDAQPDEPDSIPADGATEDERLLTACRAVGAALGIKVASPRLARADDPLRSIARASGFRTRRVRLPPLWYLGDGSPMLGRRLESGRPVALIPKAGRGYTVFDPETGARSTVTEAVAESLRADAVAFTRTLPPEPASFAGLVRFALPMVRTELRTLATAALAAGLLGLVVPFAAASAINEAIPSADRDQLTLICTLILGTAFALASFQAIQAVALARLRGVLEAGVLPAFWDRLLNLPARFFAGYDAGDLAVRTLGLSRLIEALASTTVSAMVVALVAPFNLIALLVLNWRLGLVAVGLVAVIPLGTLAATVPIRRCHREIAALRGEIAGLLFLLLGGIARLRVAGAEARAFARWSSKYQQQLRQSLRLRAIAGRVALLGEAWGLAIVMVTLGLATTAAPFAGVGDFLAFDVSLMQVVAAVIGLGRGAFVLLDGLRECERIRPILEAEPEATALAESVKLGGAIRIGTVSFRYMPEGPLVLDSVDFQVRPGEFVAIVGPSGSGKSTLLRLLLGFETPTDGTIAYDGRDLATLDVQEVRRQLGVVLQDARMQPGDLYSNIVGLATNLNRDDAWEAAGLAGLADDIEEMPMGMHTVVTEGGAGLSSGQRQRVMIARALAGRPKILLLDEATSALDNRTQAHVSQSIHSRLRGTTRVAIAHRLSTVVNADRIYVMVGGKIVQSGRYAELIAESGPFRDLAQRQLLAEDISPAPPTHSQSPPALEERDPGNVEVDAQAAGRPSPTLGSVDETNFLTGGSVSSPFG